jgi:hypothetical protein
MAYAESATSPLTSMFEAASSEDTGYEGVLRSAMAQRSSGLRVVPFYRTYIRDRHER